MWTRQTVEACLDFVGGISTIGSLEEPLSCWQCRNPWLLDQQWYAANPLGMTMISFATPKCNARWFVVIFGIINLDVNVGLLWLVLFYICEILRSTVRNCQSLTHLWCRVNLKVVYSHRSPFTKKHSRLSKIVISNVVPNEYTFRSILLLTIMESLWPTSYQLIHDYHPFVACKVMMLACCGQPPLTSQFSIKMTTIINCIIISAEPSSVMSHGLWAMINLLTIDQRSWSMVNGLTMMMAYQ